MLEESALDAPVPRSHFRLEDAPRSERYDLWRDSIACIFEVEAARDLRRDGDFRAEIETGVFSTIMLARTRTLEQRWARTPALMARDGMDHYMIQLYERGDMLWEDKGGLRSFPQNGLVVFDLSQPIATRTNNFANISLLIPRAQLEDQLKVSSDQHLRVLTGGEPMVQILRDHMRSLMSVASRLTVRQAAEIAPATVSLAAACLNVSLCPEDPRQRAGAALARLVVARRFIERHLSDAALTADRVAAEVGVSRSKLYQLFEGYGGVAAYIRDRRLRRALVMLTAGAYAHYSVYEIALMSCYASDAAFVRAFRQRYGATPNDVRLAKSGWRTSDGGSPRVDRRHEDWVRHLCI
jgi:AraC-like DNA-binding protein